MNTDLSETGFKRAGDLKKYLIKKEIDLIYSTPYKRTAETAAPLAEEKNIQMESDGSKEQKTLVPEIKSLKGHHEILLFGSSNTVLNLLRDFGVNSKQRD
jgi:broad specificity phosphatase PhoE